MNVSQLREFLDYNPETGVIVWTAGNYKGREAGSITEHGYRALQLGGKKIYSHRAAFALMTGSSPKKEIDHINGIRNDNRWSNLREVSHQENRKNSSMTRQNTSGHTGVVRNNTKAGITWYATIKSNDKDYFLGSFKDKKDAIRARALAEIHFNFHRNHGRDCMYYDKDDD